MSAYVVVQIVVADPTRYERYKELAPPSIGMYGGRYLVRGGPSEVLEGSWQPARLVVLEFPDAERARTWWNSPEYAPAKAMRQASAETEMLLIEGGGPVPAGPGRAARPSPGVGGVMERAVPVLPANDLAVARRFYVEDLGFEVTFEVAGDGTTGMLGVRRGTIAIIIDCPMDGHGRDACVSLEVDDADRYYEEWRTRVPGLKPPRNETWGARTFDFSDPSGNTIFVMGPLRTGLGEGA